MFVPKHSPKMMLTMETIKVTRFRTLIPPYQEKKINALMLLGCVHNSPYHWQVPVQIGAVFRQLVPDSALYTPIDNPLKFSAHKHRPQRRSQKKINQFILSRCVRTWFASTISGTNQIWVDIFIRA